MKKLLRNLSVLSFVLAAFLTTGCYEKEVPFLEVDHEVVLVGPQTDKGTVVVESNLQWEATSEVEWITLDNGFGNHKGTFEFFVAANTTPNERSGKIVLKDVDGIISKTILVRQQSEGSVLTIATDEISFTKDAGDYLMSVACNGDWKVTSSADWCKVDPASGNGNGAFKISVDENATGADRVATICILTDADGKTEVREITVYQSASNAVLVVSPESKQLTAAASTFELDVITVGSWAASLDSDWLTLSETSGKGDAQITVSATKNDTGKERIAIITFATGAENENRVIRQIVVRQSAVDFYLVVPVTDYPLTLDEQTIEIPYVLEGSNVTVSASSSVKWMSVASVADGIATVNVQENGTANPREGIISFVTSGQDGDPIVRQVRVAQAPTINLLDVLADEYAVEWTGETFRIPIYSNTPVIARSSEDWCNVAVDGQDVVITVPENATAAPRVAIVTVTTSSDTGAILSKTTIVRQAAAYSELVVSPAEKNIYATAYSFIASIVTNNSWTASSDSDWLTIDKANGTGDYMLTINAAENKTGRPRTAIITIQTGIENSQRESATITVTQSAEQFFLEVPVRFYPLSLAAQTIEIPYSVEGSNVTVTASSNVKWMTVNSVADGVATVNVAENTTGQAREGIITFMTLGQAGDPEVRQVVVAQAPTINILDVLADEYAVEWTGETFRIPIYTNTPVTVRSSEPWCEVAVDGQNIVITVPENLTAYARTAVVTVTTDSESGDILSKTTIVRQAAAYSELVVSPETKNVYAIAQSFVASIVTNNSWTASSDSDWLTIDKAEGNGDYMLTVNVAENKTGQVRVAVITIQTGIENSQRESATITVTQRPEQFYFEVPTRSYLVDKWGGAIGIPYVTSGNEESVVASANVDWIRVDEVEDGVAHVQVFENKTDKARTGIVTITCTPVFGDPIAIPVTFTQSPTVNILDVFVDVIDVSAKGDEVALPYYANTPVSVSSSEEWCHVMVTEDDDSYSAECCSYSEKQKIIKIEVDPNRTGEARVAFVTIATVSDSGEHITKVITIRQAALYAALSVTPKEVVIPAHNAEFTMTINTTGTWWATNSSNWLTNPVDGGVSTEAAGFGDAVINWTAADNTTGYDRRAQITVATGPENNEREEQVVNITQLKQDTYIYIPEEAYAISKLQQVLNVGYFSAGDFSDMQVNCSEDWIVYDAANSDATTLAFNVAENTTAEPRTAIVTVTLQRVAGEPISDSFIVTQAPTINILDAYVSSVEASPQGQRFILPFYTNTDINAVSSDDRWCHVIVNPDTDPGDLVILVDRNEDAEARTAYVTLTTVTDKGEKLTHIITVHQNPLNALLSVSPEKVVIPAHNASFWTMVITTGTWAVDWSANWIRPDEDSGEGDLSIEWTADDNETGLQRETTLVIWTGEENETRVEKRVQVIQLATDTYLEIPMDNFVLSKEEQTFHVAMFAAGDITNADYDYNADWLTVTEFDIDSNLLGVKVQENTTAEPRTATVTVTIERAGGEPFTDSFTVTQAGTYNVLDGLSDKVVADAAGETFELPVITNVETLSAVVSEQGWITLDPVTVDNGYGVVKFEVAANATGKDRHASITVITTSNKGETLEKKIMVYQPAADTYFAILSGENVLVTKAESDITVSAYASVNADKVTMISNAPWIAVKTAPAVAADPQIVEGVFTVAENTTGVRRQGEIIVTFFDEKGDTVQKRVVVNQAATDGGELAALVDYITVAAEGETVVLTFETEDPLTATPSATWITKAEVDDSTDPQTLTIEAAENTTGKDRIAYITVSNGSESVIITVFQPAKDTHFAILSPDIICITSDEQDVTISAFADVNADQVVALSNASWLANPASLSVSGTKVDGVFHAAKNETGEARTAVVKFTFVDEAGNTVERSVEVMQAAAASKLIVPVDYLVMDAMGEALAIGYISEPDITAVQSSDWISASKSAGVLTITAAENATGNDRRGFVTVSNGGEMAVINVFQPAKEVLFGIITARTLYIDSAAHTGANGVTVVAFANDADEVNFMSNSLDWLTATSGFPISAGSRALGRFDAKANTSTEPRTAEIKVTFKDEKGDYHEDYVTVVQAGADPESLEALVDYIVLPSAADETQTVSFLTTADAVTVSATPAWLEATPAGTDVTFKTLSENTTGADRTAYVTINAGSLKVMVTVVQLAAETQFAVLSPDIIHLDAAAQTVNITAYGSTVASVDDMTFRSDASWLAGKPKTLNGKNVTRPFAAEENTAPEAREASVLITYIDAAGKTHTATVLVIQAGAKDDSVLEALVDNITVSPAGEVVTLGFNVNEAITSAIGSDTWLNVSFANETVTITAAANETGYDRTGYVTVKNGKLTAIVTVFQPAADTEFALISPDVMMIGSAASSFKITAYGSTVDDVEDIAIRAGADWLTPQPKTLNGNRVSRVFDAAANTAAEPRTAIVKVTYVDQKGATQSADVTVIQAAADPDPNAAILEALVDNITVSPAGEVVTLGFNVRTAITNAFGSSSWLSVTKDNETVTITAAANETGYDRTGYVTVKNGQLSAIITVFQPAANTEFALLSPDVIHIDAASQDVNISAYGSTVDAVDDMTFRSDAGWLSGKPKTISGKNVSRPFTAAENTSAEAREATVLVTFIDDAGKTYTANVRIVQSGANDDSVLDALVDYVALDPAGETIKIGFIANDNIQSAMSSSAWLSANFDAAGSYVVLTAQANTTGRDRKAYVTVKNSTKTAMIEAFQPAGATEFVALDPNVVVTSLKQQLKLAFYASEPVNAQSITFLSSDASEVTNGGWLSLTPAVDGSQIPAVHIDVEANTTGSPRTAIVKATWRDSAGKNHEQEVTVTQSPSENYLDVYVDTMIVPYLETEDRLPIADNATSVVPRSSNANWLYASIITNTDTGTRDVKVKIAKNETGEPRTGYITITAKFADGTSEEKVITVLQTPDEAGLEDMYYFYLALSSVTLPMEGGEKSVEVYTSATDYTMVSSAPWLTATKGSIKLNAEPNDTGADREATVTVTATYKNGETEDIELNVIQKGTTDHYLNYTEFLMFQDGFHGTLSVPLNTDADAIDDASIVVTTGDGSAPIDWMTVTADGLNLVFDPEDNPTGETRDGKVTFTVKFADGTTKDGEINFKQDVNPALVPYLYAQSTIHIKSNGKDPGNDSPAIEYYTNQTDISATIEDAGFGTDWLSISLLDLSNHQVDLSIDPNPDMQSRVATLVIKAGDLEAKVAIKQAFGNEDPNYLETVTNINLARGSKESFPIHTNAIDLQLIPPTDCDWMDSPYLTQDPDTGVWSITISILAESYYTTLKSATIGLKATFANGETKTSEIEVARLQDREHWLVAPKAVCLEGIEGSEVFTVSTDCPVFSLITFEPEESWVRITHNTGDFPTRFQAEAEEWNGIKPRSCLVNVKATYDDGSVLTTVFAVKQFPKAEMASHAIAFNPYHVTMGDRGGSQTVTILTSGTVLSVESYAGAWFELDNIDLTNKTFEVSMSPNTGASDREGYVTALVQFGEEDPIKASIPVHQMKPSAYFNINFPSEYTIATYQDTYLYLPFECSELAPSLSLDITYDPAGDPWCRLNNTNSNVIVLRIARNDDSSPRSATVTFTYTPSYGEPIKQTITFTQPKSSVTP